MTMENLIEGYRRFRATRFEHARELYLELARAGQTPKVLFVACCDSRVDPSAITDSGPGELFVIRNVANLVPPFTPDHQHHGTSAALEFAVKQLGVEHIIVLGHAHCGGVQALFEKGGSGENHTDFIDSWMHIATDAREKILGTYPDAGIEAQLRHLEHEIVRLGLANLMTFDWIRERVEAGTLRTHGWYFGIGEGILYELDQVSDRFLPL